MQSTYLIIALGLWLPFVYTDGTSKDTFIYEANQLYIEEDQIQSLYLNKTSITQDTYVKYFKLNLENELLRNKFLTIEVHFTKFPQTSTFSPVVTAKIGQRPSLYNQDLLSSDINSNQATMDYNAYVDDEMSAKIVLKPEDVNTGNNAYIAVYNPQVPNVHTTIEYKIEVTASGDFPCPQNCSNHGMCDQTQQKCICNTGFFGLDCSAQATLLFKNTLQTQLLEADKWKYFYISTNEFNKGFLLHVEKPEDSPVYVLASYNMPKDFGLVSLTNAQEKFYLLHNKVANLQIFHHSPPQNDGQILIGVYNIDDKPITLSIQIKKQGVTNEKYITKRLLQGDYTYRSNDSSGGDDPPIIQIVLIAIGVFLALCVCGIILKRAENQRLRQYETNQLHLAQTGRQEPIETNEVLTKEDFDMYFPKKKYADIKDPFTHKTCSVCLDDFEDSVECHQLYCKHVFHEACIEAWLAKHDSCPNCKKIMTKVAIEEFLKAEAQENELKEGKEANSVIITQEIKLIPDNPVRIQIEGDGTVIRQDILPSDEAKQEALPNTFDVFVLKENNSLELVEEEKRTRGDVVMISIEDTDAPLRQNIQYVNDGRRDVSPEAPNFIVLENNNRI